MNFSLNIKYTFSEPQPKEQSHIFVREYVGCSLWWHWWMSNWTWWLCWGRVTFQMRTAYGRNFRFPCFWVFCRCNMHANLFDIHHKRVIILGLSYVFIYFGSKLAFVYMNLIRAEKSYWLCFYIYKGFHIIAIRAG